MKNIFFLAACLCALIAHADISPAKRLQGQPVAKDGTPAKWVFALGKSIAVVNSDGELWLHDLNGDTVGPARQVKGATIAKDSTPPRFVFSVGIGTQVAVVNAKGELWIHEIKDTIRPARQIQGAAIDGKYLLVSGPGMFATVNEKGELWLYSAIDKVSEPQLLKGATIAKDGTPARFVINTAKGIGIINTNGELWVHEVTNVVAPAKQIAGAPLAKDAKYAFTMGTQIIVVGSNGEVLAHELSATATAVETPSPLHSCDLRGRWTKRYDKRKDGSVDKTAMENEIEVSGEAGRLVARYVGKEAKNKSTFELTCTEGATTTVTIVQKDNAYKSEIAASLALDGTIVGTWHDSKKNTGDIVLMRSSLVGQ